MKARVCAPVGKIYPGGVPLVGGCPHSSPTTATRTAHAVRSDFGQATSHAPRQRPTARTQALCPAGSAVAALPRRSTADKKKPASDCTRGGQTVMWVAEPDGGIRGVPVYVRTFPLAPLPAGCMPFFITRGTQRGFSRSALDWCNTSGPDNANTRNNRGGCCHGEFNPQCVGIEFGMPRCVQKRCAGVFKACRNDGG